MSDIATYKGMKLLEKINQIHYFPDLSKGIYFLKLESTKGTSTHKIVKK